MDDLVSWLRVQLDDDERIARSATPGPWRAQGLPYVDGDDDADIIAADGRWVAGLTYDGLSTTTAHEVDEDGAHIVRNDPARVLAEVDAKRCIIALAASITDQHDDEQVWYQQAIGDVLRLLALPYADRPGYRDEWAPTA